MRDRSRCSAAAGSAPTPNTAESWAAMVDGYQQAALWPRRSRIPMIYGIDAVHGHGNVHGATIFPHNIGLGAADDPDLVERIGTGDGAGDGRHGHPLELLARRRRPPGHPVGPHLRGLRRGSGHRGDAGSGARPRPAATADAAALSVDQRAGDGQALHRRRWPPVGAPRRRRGFIIDQGDTRIDEAELRAASLAAVPGRRRRRRARHHGLVQQLERHEDARQPIPADRTC